MSEPFVYPATAHVRRHGPMGYESYESYRPWLRDEFCFRCVYCLSREVWAHGAGSYHIDHFLPIVNHPDLAADYDNLLYSCSTCNSYKRERIVADPLRFLTQSNVEIDEKGMLIAKTTEVASLIEFLRLNDDQALEFRRLWIEIVQLAKLHDLKLFQKLVGFPQDIPNLKSLQPPGGNTQLEGIPQSYYEQRKRGELPVTY